MKPPKTMMNTRVLPDDKSRWEKVAALKNQTLTRWLVETLNAEAAKIEAPKP